MKINELKPSQAKTLTKTQWHFPKEIKTWLIKNKFELLGHGSYSLVYATPGSNIVVKISKKEDVCWLNFVDYVKKKKGNPHLPKISRVTKYVDNLGDTNFIAFMEKLEPIHSGANIDPDDYEGLTFLGNWFMAASRTIEPFVASRRTESKIFAYKYARKNPLFFRTLQELKRMVRGKCYLDTHFENFMIRPSTNEIVIIDPAAFPISQ